MSTFCYDRAFKEGVEAACALLQETADDYLQMSDQVKEDHTATANTKAIGKAYREKSDLLRGQIKNIRSNVFNRRR